MFILIFLIVTLTLCMVQIKKIWLIDSELTERLVTLASAGHLLEGKSADMRIESGLKLLETVLPLSEAIVFRFDRERRINSGRTRPQTADSADDSLDFAPDRMARNVGLCEQAIDSRGKRWFKSDENQNETRRR